MTRTADERYLCLRHMGPALRSVCVGGGARSKRPVERVATAMVQRARARFESNEHASTKELAPAVGSALAMVDLVALFEYTAGNRPRSPEFSRT